MGYENLIFGIATGYVEPLTVMLIVALIFDYIRTMIFSSK